MWKRVRTHPVRATKTKLFNEIEENEFYSFAAFIMYQTRISFSEYSPRNLPELLMILNFHLFTKRLNSEQRWSGFPRVTSICVFSNSRVNVRGICKYFSRLAVTREPDMWLMEVTVLLVLVEQLLLVLVEVICHNPWLDQRDCRRYPSISHELPDLQVSSAKRVKSSTKKLRKTLGQIYIDPHLACRMKILVAKDHLPYTSVSQWVLKESLSTPLKQRWKEVEVIMMWFNPLRTIPLRKAFWTVISLRSI